MVLEFIINYVVQIIQSMGYMGIFLLMFLEIIFFFIPSEVIMAFVGFLIATGKFNWALALIVSTLGSVAAAVVFYYAGKYGGRLFVLKYGKYVFMKEHHLKMTEDFFKKHGDLAILLSRLVPIARDLISIPAGMAKMNFKQFLLFTTIASATWNTMLILVGYSLGENWAAITQYSKELDLLVIIILVIAGIIYLIKKLKE
jgi:membrane protein DedA with SNARE-associated domain